MLLNLKLRNVLITCFNRYAATIPAKIIALFLNPVTKISLIALLKAKLCIMQTKINSETAERKKANNSAGTRYFVYRN